MRFIQIMLAVAAAAAVVYFGLNALSPTGQGTSPHSNTAATTGTAARDQAARQPHAADTRADTSVGTTADAAAGATGGAGNADSMDTAASASSTEEAGGTVTADQARQIARQVGLAAARQNMGGMSQGSTSDTGATSAADAGSTDLSAADATTAGDLSTPDTQRAAADPGGPASRDGGMSGGDTAAPTGTGDNGPAAPQAGAGTLSGDAGGAHGGSTATPSQTATGAVGSGRPGNVAEADNAPSAAAGASTPITADTGASPATPSATASRSAVRPAPHHGGNMPEPTRPQPPLPLASTALLPWWTPNADVKPGQFALVYAGPASFSKAIVLLFSRPVAETSSDGIRVINRRGQPVKGSWTVSDKNPRMLIFDTDPGHYTVSVPAGVKDGQGTSLGNGRSGPVTIR